MADLITSTANPTVKRIKALAQRKYRRREAAFTVEGLQPVWRAVTSGWEIDLLVACPELITHDAAAQMVAEQRSAGVPVAEVSRSVFQGLSDRDGPSGLLAVVRGTAMPLARFTARPGRPVVALHRVGNPGNIGTIVRSADAAGAAGVVLVGDCADAFAPSAVKASMGSIFAVPVAACASVDEVFTWAASYPRATVAVTGHASENLWRTRLPGDAMILMGSEGDGLPDEVADRCDARVAIAMEGTAESLNLATATSVALYDLKRRRDTDRSEPGL